MDRDKNDQVSLAEFKAYFEPLLQMIGVRPGFQARVIEGEHQGKVGTISDYDSRTQIWNVKLENGLKIPINASQLLLVGFSDSFKTGLLR